MNSRIVYYIISSIYFIFLGSSLRPAMAQSFTDSFSGTTYNTANWMATGGASGSTVVVNNKLTFTTNNSAWTHCWIKAASNLYGFVNDPITGGSTSSVGFSLNLANITQSGGSGVRWSGIAVYLVGNDATSAQLASTNQKPFVTCPTILALEFLESGTDTYQVYIYGKAGVPNSSPVWLATLSNIYAPNGTIGASISNSGGRTATSTITIYGTDNKTLTYSLPASYSPYFSSSTGSGVSLYMGALNGDTAGSIETATVNSFSVSVTGPMPNYGSWTSSHIGGGGYLQNIVFCPSNSNRLYTYVDMAGVYRSDDGGTTWRMVMNGLPTSYRVRTIDVDPVNENIVLAATKSDSNGYALFRSTNGGNSWTPVLNGVNFYGNGCIFRSDGVLILHNPNNSNSVIVATQDNALGSIYTSADNGATWTQTGQLPSTWPGGMLADRSNGNHIWLWTRGGIITDESNVVHGPFSGGLYESFNFGQTWTRITTNLYNNQSPNHIVQDPSDPTVLWGTASIMNADVPYNNNAGLNNLLVGKSVDGGRTWAAVMSGLPTSTAAQTTGSNNYAYNAIDASNPSGTKFLVVESGMGNVYRLNAGSSTWTAVPHTLNYGNYGWVRGAGGKNWLFGAACGWLRIDPKNSNHWFATDWFEVWQTNDAGSTWNLSSQGIENTFILDIHPDPLTIGKVHVAMSDNGYHLSNDMGKSFTNTVFISNVNSIDTTGVKAVAAAGSSWVINSVLLSSNNGASWDASPMTGLPGVTGTGMGIHMANNVCDSITIDSNTGYIYLPVSGTIAPGNGGPYVSKDGGSTWTWIGNGLPTNTAKSFCFDGFWTYSGHEIVVGKDGTILMASYNNKMIYKYNSGSQSWSTMPFPGSTSSASNIILTADPNLSGVFYASEGAGGAYKSTDNGATWTKIYTNSVYCLKVDPHKENRVVLYDSTLRSPLLSKDGGATWTNLDPNGQLGWIGSGRVASSGGKVFFGAPGGGVFWISAP